MTTGSNLRPIFYLVFLGTSWGLYFSMLKIAALSGISYPGILTLTTVGVGVGMSAIAWLRRRRPVFDLRHTGFYLVCAITGYLVPMIVELWVIASMPAGVLTLIVSMAPLATLAFAWLMRTDSLSPARVGGVLLGAFAVFAILLPDAHLNEAVAWRWLLLATLVPVSYAIHHNFTARCWPEGSDSYQVACGEAIVGSLLLIAVASFHWNWQDLESFNRGHGAILFMAGISLIDIYLYFELIRIKGPIFTSHANYFMVISGVFWGMVIFAERPGPLTWISALLLVASLYLISMRRRKEDPETVEET